MAIVRRTGLILLTILLLATACSTSLEGSGSGKGLEWAREKAEPLAALWDPDYEEAGLVGLWVDGRGELGEEADNPAWALAYTAPTKQDPIVVVVDYDGLAGLVPTDEFELEFEQPLDRYDDEDVRSWTAAAGEAIEEHPAPLEAYDRLLGVSYDGYLFQGDLAAVGFFEEADQQTEFDPESFDLFSLMEGAYAFVLVDCGSGSVLLKSWEIMPPGSMSCRNRLN